ncbi:hypothetical protein GCM10010201_20630 [Pilimelia columellifera subsp. columellifera]|uniref:M23ase beta-sheet core domain-containing protein n=1 Tax=Pilimelia columellifera subsp. columellifera TaxID=706583 RepID=A0ABN3NJB0_9ACTN
MNARAILAVGAAVPVVLVLGVTLTAAAAGTIDQLPGDCLPTNASGTPQPGAGEGAHLELNAAQRANAVIIYTVGAKMRLPHRAGIVAIATALQESHLVNLGNLGANNDHDSLGLFQQRPSQGWGTPEQIMDPVYASTKFYQRLVRVKGWEQMSVTEAAQAVQRSAFPDAYAKWEPVATKLAGDAAKGLGRDPSAGCGIVGGWTAPVVAPIVSAFRGPGRPDHHGVDFGASRGTPIRAASAGVVIVAQCQTTPADWGCNRDGGISIGGCGWYVEIKHAGNVMTRYCHMLARPAVTVGQRVGAGQILGVVGTSGNSSGPHLHFEVHLGGDSNGTGAVDPVPFMHQHGIELGKK